ncbi:jerky protein homolog-like [Armigeres subalbatus]|uniref:jerky protein homolog-like n=1 Tax=Armigeres subalbatus TaxID=124917 RepID=UPI002ED26BA8
MTRVIFKLWFFGTFVPRVEKFAAEQGIEPKAVLLLDNCSAHHFEDELVSEDGLIFVVFLPPNVTPLIQPMDQHVIQTIKSRYREKLHSENIFGGGDAAQHLKQVNLKDVAFWLQESWMEVSQNVIQRSWKNIGVMVGTKLMHEDDVPLATLFNMPNVETDVAPFEYLEEDLCVDDYNDADIIAMVKVGQNSEEECLEDEDPDESETTMDIENLAPLDDTTCSDQKAVECLNYTIRWAEENGFELVDILHLRKIKSAALDKCLAACSQSKIII